MATQGQDRAKRRIAAIPTYGMRRREFIALLCGAVMAWPLAVRSQQLDRVRRIIVFANLAESDPEMQLRLRVFRQELGKLGRKEGHNTRIDFRSWDGDFDRMRTLAKELVGLQPDVIVAQATPTVTALLKQTRTIPIVFVAVADPVGSGFVTSWTRPGGNVTGTSGEPTLAGKLLEILKEAAPNVQRVGVMLNPDTATYFAGYYLPSLKAAASALKIQLIDASVRDAAALEKAISELGSEPSSGLIVAPDAFLANHRELLIALAARYRLPAIYPYLFMARDGGLIAYAADLADQWRGIASYVDRILKGEKPGDLPVQAPTKFELVINLKTAKALGLTVPPTLLARADEVIE